ncbi:MAG: competence/damage-inducible protein A [Thermotogota bacterium]|nr:competence/damage-inducible protein A [Thermotogota bacterium]
MVCEIICVGTELLLGSVVNTNATFISEKLSTMGFSLFRQTVVGDNVQRIKDVLNSAFKSADLVIMSGGLGPTQDDLTKEAACEFFRQKMVLHDPSLKRIKSYFKDKPLSKFNEKQAMFPSNAVVLDNDNGTAPGAILEKDGKRIVLLPGPPNELRPMFEKVLAYLSRFQEGVFFSKELKFFGIGESTVVEIIEDIIENQTNPTIAPYAGDAEVKLRITASADSIEKAKELILPVERQIRNKIGNYIYGTDNDTLEKVAVQKLIENNLTLSTAESCTGGLLSSTIVDVSGASKTFLGGFITYSNEEKTNRLGVDRETLKKHGAVSSQTAEAMAKGVCKYVDTNIGISTTGIAGPTGGTKEKPVGTVFIGLCYNGEVISKRFFFRGNRGKIRIRTVKMALKMLIELIENKQ